MKALPMKIAVEETMVILVVMAVSLQIQVIASKMLTHNATGDRMDVQFKACDKCGQRMFYNFDTKAYTCPDCSK